MMPAQMPLQPQEPPQPAPAPGMPAPGMPGNPGDPPQMPPAPISLGNTDEDDSLPEFDVQIKFKSESDRAAKANDIYDKIKLSFSQMTERHARIRQFRQQYESKSYPKDTPWPNAASLNIPTTRGAVDTVHAHIYQAMTGTTPLFRVEALSMADLEVARKMESVLQWQMADQIDMPGVWDGLLKAGLIDGTKVAKISWRKESQRTRKPGIVNDDDGQPKLGDNGKPIRALVEETEYVINQPSVEGIDILDFCLYPASSKSIETAIMVGHRVWKTDNDLRLGVRDGLYDPGEVDKVLDGKAEQPDMQSESFGGDDFRTSDAGISSAQANDPEDRPYELFEVICLHDSDGDGIKEDCLFVIEMSTRTLIRAEVYPYWHNERCYVDFTPSPREGNFFGYSIPEILESLHAEINAIRNQRVDAGTIFLSPVLAARRTVKLDFNRQRWRPGAVLYMDDPKNDIVPISFPSGNLQQSLAEEQSAREQAEKVTGASDYAQGASPSRSRTLGEVSQVLTEGNKKFDIIISRLHRKNNQIAQQVIGLNRQYLDAETEYSLTQMGERIFLTLTASDLQTRVRIQAQGNTLNANKELRLQAIETLYQMSQHEQIMQRPTRKYALLAAYCQEIGQENPVPFIGTEEEAQQEEQKMMNAPPQPPPPPQLAGKLDEPATLALMFKEGQITPQEYGQAAQASVQFSGAKAQAEAPPAAPAQDNTAASMALETQKAQHARIAAEHDHALAKDAAEHAANVGTVHGLANQVATNAMTPPAFPQGGSASPLPAASAPAAPSAPEGADD